MAWRPGASVPAGSRLRFTARISSSATGSSVGPHEVVRPGVERRRASVAAEGLDALAQRHARARGRRPARTSPTPTCAQHDRLRAGPAARGAAASTRREGGTPTAATTPSPSHGRVGVGGPARVGLVGLQHARAGREAGSQRGLPLGARPRSTPRAAAARRRATRPRRPPARRAPSASAAAKAARASGVAPSSTTVRAASATGCSRKATSVTTASVPSEPHSSLARS